MNKVVKGLLTALISLFLLAYVGYQTYLALYHPVRTVRAMSSTVKDTVSAESFVLHDETVITANTGSKVVDFARDDGERVANGGVVAYLYPTEQDARNAATLKKLGEEVSRLSQTGDSTDASAIDVSQLDSEINNTFLELADQVSASNVAGLSDAEGDLLELLNKKQLATGQEQNFNTAIANLQQQITSLNTQLSGAATSITAPAPGYFVGGVDGYENSFDMSKIQTISVSDIQSLESKKPSVKSGTIGKVVTEYKWYTVCILSDDDARKLKVGDSVGLVFQLSSEGEIPATVAALNKSGDRFAVVIACNYMTSHLATLRKQTVQIVANEYTGIKVDSGSIHIVNNQKGVFVRNGDTVQFKTIKPLYSGNGYTVSAIDSTDANRLQVYDEVIENGDDLYDGKVLK